MYPSPFPFQNPWLYRYRQLGRSISQHSNRKFSGGETDTIPDLEGDSSPRTNVEKRRVEDILL